MYRQEKMEGEMWIDEKQEKLAALNGHLMEDVKFGGGLLGRFELFNFLPCRRRCRADSQILVLALQRSPAPGVCQKRWEMRWPPRAGMRTRYNRPLRRLT